MTEPTIPARGADRCAVPGAHATPADGPAGADGARDSAAPLSSPIDVPRRCNRWNGKRRQIFLESLALTAHVSRSAAAAGMSLAAAYNLKKRDRAFAEAWREALEIGFSELEMTLLRQSLHGSERIETVVEGEGRTLKYEKTTRSFSMSVSVRLFEAHRAEVTAYRQAREAEPPEGSAREEARAWLNQIRERIAQSERRRAEAEAAEGAAHGEA